MLCIISSTICSSLVLTVFDRLVVHVEEEEAGVEAVEEEVAVS